MHKLHTLSKVGRSSSIASIVLAAVALFALPLAASAQSVVLTADTYYATAGTTGNVGAASSFTIGGAAGDVGLVQFDLTTLPAGVTAANVGEVTLVIYVNGSVSSAGAFDVSLASSPWTETGVSSTNFPTTGTLITAGTNVPLGATVVEVNVTAAVNAWLSGTPNYGLVLSPSASSAIKASFVTKDDTADAHSSQLVVILNPGITGATGATGAGIAGATGATGATGLNGINGATGATGIGLAGATGATGAIGTTGATGAAGATGGAGATGATGAAGATGSAGSTGSAGATGATGPFVGGAWSNLVSYPAGAVVQYLSNFYLSLVANSNSTPSTSSSYWSVMHNGGPYAGGTNYPLGSVVLNGSVPYECVNANGCPSGTALANAAYYTAIGSAGATGATGVNGINGATGFTGATGNTGLAGATGAVGATGATGAAGSTGSTGTTGATGAAGATGSTGATGSAGATGATGVTGSAGVAGTTGATGATGAVGPTGTVQSIAIGTVATTGSTGSASIGGTTANPTINLTFPAGGSGGGVTSVSAGTITTSGTVGTLSIGGTSSAPTINANFPSGTGAVYGDGSDGTTAGECAFTSNTNLLNFSVKIAGTVIAPSTQPTGNFQCTNITVSSGVVVVVPSGTVFKATGTVNIAGEVYVFPNPQVYFQNNPNIGGYYGTDGSYGIAYQFALPAFQQRRILTGDRLWYGCQGGNTPYAYDIVLNYWYYGLGGGGFAIYSAGGITISSGGSIHSDGGGAATAEDAYGNVDGGGAGGIIVLASKTSISNSGTLSAAGGAGAIGSFTYFSPGGGGGGGIINLLAPSITAGTTVVTGGAAGGGSNQSPSGTPQQGNPGGTCGGQGGSGTGTNEARTAFTSNATAGAAGNVFTTILADPATLIAP